MSAIVHREPAHVDRSDWTYRHVTAPAPAVFDGEQGNRRRVAYLVNNLLIGDETLLPDGRKVYREHEYTYHVYRYFELMATCSTNQILPYLLDGVDPHTIQQPKRQKRAKQEDLPPRKSRYHHVIFNRVTGSWYAQIQVDYVNHKLPARHTEEEAARDYDNFVIENGLTDRPLNFPQEQGKVAA